MTCDAARSPSLHGAPLWLLAMVTLVGPLSMHIFVPTMPAVETGLHASHVLIQTTLTAYVLGLGCGQLLLGPLSDRFGRRPVLLGGMAIYVAASLVALLAPIAMAEVLNVDPDVEGASSGLYGCTQMPVGAICTSLAGLGSSPTLSAGLTLLGGTMVAQLCLQATARETTEVAGRED